MSGGYVLATGGTTITGASTLVFLNPPAAPTLLTSFKRFWVSQSNNMSSIQQRVQISTQPTTFPTLTSQSPTKLHNADGSSIYSGGTAGAAGTCGVNASAEGSGTKSVVWADAFNVVNGWLLVPTPDELIQMSGGSSSGLGLYLPSAPGTLTNWAFGCTWVEV